MINYNYYWLYRITSVYILLMKNHNRKKKNEITKQYSFYSLCLIFSSSRFSNNKTKKGKKKKKGIINFCVYVCEQRQAKVVYSLFKSFLFLPQIDSSPSIKINVCLFQFCVFVSTQFNFCFQWYFIGISGLILFYYYYYRNSCVDVLLSVKCNTLTIWSPLSSLKKNEIIYNNSI